MGARRKVRKDEGHARKTVRCVVYLPEESVRQWGLACLAERRRRSDWLAGVIEGAARKYVLSVREGPSREGAPTAAQKEPPAGGAGGL